MKATQNERHSALNATTCLMGLVRKVTLALTRHICPNCGLKATLKFICPECGQKSDIFKLTLKESEQFRQYAGEIESCESLMTDINQPKEEQNNED